VAVEAMQLVQVTAPAVAPKNPERQLVLAVKASELTVAGSAERSEHAVEKQPYVARPPVQTTAVAAAVYVH